MTVESPGQKLEIPPAGTKRINLALQGGGAHGAFTWGVIDQLLADGRLRVEGVSGTSAGAVNAVMLADGLARGGPKEAQKRLADLWRAVSTRGQLDTMQRAVLDRLLSFFPLESTPVGMWFDVVGRFFPPYDLRPLDINPLRGLIERFVDFDAVRAFAPLQLFVSATDVHTGRLRVFSRERITADVILASTCLPMLFRAVEIDGVPHWDGGYLGNPALFPFFHTTATEDVLIVQLNPLERRMTPTSSREILDRVNEISFNSSLLAEVRAIAFVARLIDEGRLPHGTAPGEYRRINLHRIALDVIGHDLSAASRMSTDFEFFEFLRDEGRRSARTFLEAHFDDIGVRGTVDLSAEARAEWA
jgi:NTE family protein